MKRICALILVLLWAWSVVGNNPVPGDSVGVKTVDGKTLIVYKVSAGETAYAVSRKYAIAFKDLSAANSGVDMGALKAGQEILVPGNFAAKVTPVTKTEPVVTKNEVVVNEPIVEPKVVETEPEPKAHVIETPVKTETQAEIIKEEPVVAADPVAADPAMLSEGDLTVEPVVETADKTKSFAQLYAGYLSTDMIATSEKGVATWIENNGIQTANDRFYALHSTAPIGSIVKVRNLMNNRTIYAKVIGSLSESEKQEKVLIKLSAGAAERLNVLDNRFVVEMTYYLAEDKAMK
ncbi:MAG: LysM peptidoglycan-binding domain-containing protein [Chitinophagales bacterium]|nr:LysM peptidoglycan-binding domain-containing protein [Bacteroidota bacterium]MBP8917459.1 LysM peptidoglycan-binding domain-containing protein [Chitinophagales bacterium]MBP9221906.1 LysM peptidoglycan-binding domain-containing protein [Chitinophagales bacterium]MBP9797131.1 LysM peptidoglycan-binding domain-containing protein [Chitinophagales bacterium]